MVLFRAAEAHRLTINLPFLQAKRCKAPFPIPLWVSNTFGLEAVRPLGWVTRNRTESGGVKAHYVDRLHHNPLFILFLFFVHNLHGEHIPR